MAYRWVKYTCAQCAHEEVWDEPGEIEHCPSCGVPMWITDSEEDDDVA